MCKWKTSGFPGSQPVSMDTKNIKLLHQKPYRVSWKADGARYMMLILKEGEVYFFDRDNSVFQVEGLRFPLRSNLNEHLMNTLIDGVSDKMIWAKSSHFNQFMVFLDCRKWWLTKWMVWVCRVIWCTTSSDSWTKTSWNDHFSRIDWNVFECKSLVREVVYSRKSSDFWSKLE